MKGLSCQMSSIFFGALLMFLSHIPGGDGLDCFKCISAWTVKECMQDDPETCGWGQICASTVERGGVAGVRHTKSCMDDSQCYSLQNLNNGKSCDQNPSICVFCCETELCNAAVTSLPLGMFPYILTSSIIVRVFC